MYISDKIEVRQTQKGKAVIAADDIAPNEVLFEFEKKFLDHPTRLSMQIDGQVHQISDNPLALENLLNHSCDPNGFINFDDLTFRASCQIKKGEELAFNYLTSEWDLANKFTCHCGSQNCYGQIKGFKYLGLKQKKKLEPLLSPFLKEKYLESVNN